MPWVHSHRERLKQPRDGAPDGDPMADEVLDCTSCRARTVKAERAAMGCGWLPVEERTGEDWFTPKGAPEPTVCPGYTIVLPEVLEAARALGWRQDGQLLEFYDGEKPTEMLKTLCDVVATEIGRASRRRPRDVS